MTSTGGAIAATPADRAQSRPATRQKVTAALLAAAGAGLVLASAGRDWADATVTSPVRLSVHATGSSITSLPYALGLAALAGAVALFAVRRIGRYLVGLVLLGAGGGIIAAVATNLGQLDGTQLTRAAEQTVGVAAAQLSGVTNSAWPYVTMVGGVLVALAGTYTLLRGRAWNGLSNRYEVAAGSAEVTGGVRRNGPAEAHDDSTQVEPSTRELWDSINRGADPTV
jgi:uncharacterized membrane protein (TIGR02234 family)